MAQNREVKYLEKTEIVENVSKIRVQRKKEREKKGEKLVHDIKLNDDDYMHMFAELDRRGTGQCVVTIEAISELTDLLGETLQKKHLR